MPGPTRRSWRRWIGSSPTERMQIGPTKGRLGYRPGGYAVGPDEAGSHARWSLLYGREGRQPREQPEHEQPEGESTPSGRLPCSSLLRRWTGIEPARRGSPVSAALKAVGPTRRPDTSGGEATAGAASGLSPRPAAGIGSPAMKKLLFIAVLVALGVLAAKKVRSAN